MEAFLEYILKASGILMVFYLTYDLFLKKETFFKANRHFLLSGLLVALIVPLLTITKYVDANPIAYGSYSDIPISLSENSVASTMDWTVIFSYIYLFGCVLFLLIFSIQLLSLRSMIKGHKVKKEDGFVYVETSGGVAPFSFFNHIFYNPDLYNHEELQAILEHERAHSSQWHSLDVLLAHAITIVLWVNPVCWLYKKHIKQNLEFLADASASKSVSSLKSYQYTLLRVSGVPFATQITNAFYNSLIKKRIVMLHKSKSNKRNLYKYVLVLPLLLLFVLVFNVETKARPIPVNEIYTYSDTMFFVSDQQYMITRETTDDEIASLTIEIKNKGGSLAVKKIKRNKDGHITSIKVSYKMSGSEVVGQYSNEDGIPPIQFGEKANGNLFINGGSEEAHGHKFIHIVSDDDTEYEHEGDFEVIVNGSGKHEEHENVWISKDDGDEKRVVIKKVDGKKTIIVNGEEVSEEEFENDRIIHKKRIKIKSSEDPGDKNVMIIMNDDDEDHDIEVISPEKNAFFFIDTDGDKEPLFMIDGKEATEKEVKALSPDRIATINVMKDKKAEEKYGKKGKNGVVDITTKKKD